MKKRFFLSLLTLGFVCLAQAQQRFEATPNPTLTQQKWSAQWITHPNVSLYDYGVYHFRKTFALRSKPETFVVNVSADNRYRLFVNGTPVCWGPARGDLAHWYFETVDLAPLLQAGNNVVAAVVWNFGEWAPGAQTTLQTGFILQGNTTDEWLVNTDTTWKVYQNKAYSPLPDNRQDVGCGDRVQGDAYPWEWETLAYTDTHWQQPRLLGKGQPYGLGTLYDWVLLPRDIPLMEESLLRMQAVRRAENIVLPTGFLQGKAPVTIAPNTRASFLIDQQFLTTAYPQLHVSGGKGSSIRFTYCEALFDGRQKGNRNEVEGRTVHGFSDQFLPDGANNRMYRPLWFKTYRYIQVDIETTDAALTLNDLYGMYTGYPFKENGSFASNDASIRNIWTVGWRTARLCAHETYFDCPYYEQLQYVGDTRIQALISLYVDGDDRLMKKAIRTYDWSRTYEGITASRYPSRVPQYIPPFSLYWINMVHDYWMHRDDSAFVKTCIPGVKTILEWFASKVDEETGMLGGVPHWNFVDWPREWPWSTQRPTGGTPPGAIEGGSAILSLQLAYTLKDAIGLLAAFGETDLAARYTRLYNTLCQQTYQACWDSQKQLLKDDRPGTSYSQHANIMGILSDAVPADQQRDLFDRLNQDPSLIQATFYYRFYLFRALKKVGQADRYTSMLTPWYDMLKTGLTTFAENPEPTRSDCHAWSSSPNYDLLATVCGVEPASPGFATVRISPHLGHLKNIQGVIPHPKGNIRVNLQQTAKGLKGTVVLPANLSGTFVWKESSHVLRPGSNTINY